MNAIVEKIDKQVSGENTRGLAKTSNANQMREEGSAVDLRNSLSQLKADDDAPPNTKNSSDDDAQDANNRIRIGPELHHHRDSSSGNDKEYWAAVRAVHQEIQRMPPSDTAAYFQACDAVSPTVLRNEANALQFLQFESLDFAAAARRLCRYWAKRQELFGDDDRWALPVLCVDGTGALSDRDLKLLRTGFLVKLQPDATERAVLCLDQSRCQHLHRLDVSRVRCWFFWFQEITCCSTNSWCTNIHPKSGLWVLRFAGSLELNTEMLKKIGDLVNYTFPVGKLNPISCCLTLGDSAKRDDFTNILTPVMQRAYSSVLGTATPDEMSTPNKIESNTMSLVPSTLICDTADEMREALFSLRSPDGVQYFQYPESLPLSLGGCWQYSKFDAWLQHRVQYGFYQIPASSTPRRRRKQTRTRTAEELIFLRKRIRMKMDAIFLSKRPFLFKKM